MQNGGTGYHKGITRRKNGRYVLIHGSDWQGDRDWAEEISDEQALQEILRAGKEEMLEEKKYEPLKILYEEFEGE